MIAIGCAAGAVGLLLFLAGADLVGAVRRRRHAKR